MAKKKRNKRVRQTPTLRRPSHRFEVRTPCGHDFCVWGTLRIGRDGATAVVNIEPRPGSFLALDPRSIISNEFGQHVYGPRDIPMDYHDAKTATWLILHPDWQPEVVAIGPYGT